MSTETQRSRRWFVAAVGGVAAAASATVVWRSRQAAGGRRLATQMGDSPGYVDHEGWIVTPADQQRLLGASLPQAEALRPGGEAGSQR
jgi:hypothetical protein